MSIRSFFGPDVRPPQPEQQIQYVNADGSVDISSLTIDGVTNPANKLVGTDNTGILTWLNPEAPIITADLNMNGFNIVEVVGIQAPVDEQLEISAPSGALLAGDYTFTTASPLVPTPTLGGQSANKLCRRCRPFKSCRIYVDGSSNI